jgi:hypothetical protein
VGLNVNVNVVIASEYLTYLLSFFLMFNVRECALYAQELLCPVVQTKLYCYSRHLFMAPDHWQNSIVLLLGYAVNLRNDQRSLDHYSAIKKCKKCDFMHDLHAS